MSENQSNLTRSWMELMRAGESVSALLLQVTCIHMLSISKDQGQFITSWLNASETNFNNIAFSAHFSLKNEESGDLSDHFSQARRIVNGQLIHGLNVCMCQLYSTCEQSPSLLIPEAAAGNKSKNLEILTLL